MFTLRFTHFWKTSKLVREQFFIPLFEKVYGAPAIIELDPTRKVDLEVFSVFPPKPSIAYRALRRYGVIPPKITNLYGPEVVRNSRKSVWYTGENIRLPLHHEYDSYLSFESNDFHPLNSYLPLWVMNVNWFGFDYTHGFAGRNPTISELLNKRNFDPVLFSNRKYGCAFIGVLENMRQSFLHELNKQGEVDVYGRSTGRVVVDKTLVASNYKMIAAFENALHPGYVTEKLLEASLTSALPLYWGIDSAEYFNGNAFLNFYDYKSLDEFINEISRVLKSPDELAFRLEAPILAKEFDLISVIERLRGQLL